MNSLANYTMQLRQVMQEYGAEEVKSWFKDYELSDYLTADEIQVIETRGTWNKDKLAQMIVDHYYMREIGLETPALFRHQAKMLMREIMEEKAPLIYSAAIAYDPLVNVDFTETYTSQSSNSGQSSSSTSGLAVNSDTPMGQISKQEILQGKYASSTGASEASDTSSSSGSGTETYSKNIKGNSGVSATAQKMVEQYRDNIITINRDIINEVNQLFMGIY